MPNKKKELTIDDILEKIYYFLKEKLSFDDIQAITFIASIILLPFSLFFGYIYSNRNFPVIFIYNTWIRFNSNCVLNY